MTGAITLLFALLLVVPSANYHLFNGLPLSSLVELTGLALLVPLPVSRGMRAVLMRAVGWLPRLARRSLVAVGLLALGAKIALLASGTHGGFLACYRSPAAAPPGGSCERSYENPLFRFAVTRLDPVLDFGPGDWNLSFFNSHRLAFLTERGNVVRARLPLDATWRGPVESSRPWTAQITYVGEPTLRLGSAPALILPPHYAAMQTALVPIPPGRHEATLHYRFDDGSRVGIGPPPGPYATFRVRRLGLAGEETRAVSPARPPRLWRAVARGVDAVTAAFVVLLAALYAALLRREWAMLALVATGGYAAYAYRIPWPGVPKSALFLAVLWLLFGRLLARNRTRSLLLAYVSLVGVNGFLARRSFPSLATVSYRSAGDDWLTYESLARTILETWSLEGGEPVFEMQPLFRYIRFGEHLLLGDGDPFLLIAALTALEWGVFWLAARLGRGRRLPGPWAALFAVSGAGLLTLASSTTVVQFFAAGLSEYPTWISLSFLFVLLFLSRSAMHGLLGTALLGLSCLTRANQTPALAVVFLVYVADAWRASRRVALASAALLFGLLLLPLAHNAYYGGRLILVTTGASVVDNLVAPPSAWLAAARDLAARELVWRHLRYLLYLTTSGEPLLQVALHGLQLAWLLGVAGLLVSRRALSLRAWILVCLPALYLGVHLFYRVQVYYPRHVLIGYFAMGVAAMYAARLRAETRRETDHVTVGSSSPASTARSRKV